MAVQLAARYDADPESALRKMPALSALPDAALSTFSEGSLWVELQPGERLSAKLPSSLEERFYFVAEGQVGVGASFTRDDPERLDLKVEKGTSRNRHDFILYFVEGDCFSDGYLRLPVSAAGGTGVDCVAIMGTVLASIPRDRLERLMGRYPDFKLALGERNETLRERYEANAVPESRMIQEFFLRHNYSIAKSLKVIDLDACIGCDGCERACESRHGTARIVRRGPVLGRLSFPISCRTCVDHRCVPACGFDSIGVPEGGEVRINQATCVGCAACYTACPNGVIEMLEAPYEGKDFPKPMPHTDDDGRTNIDGLYLVGEAAGAALIKVAINGGTKAAEAAAEAVGAGQGNGAGDADDVVIVGAGPGGIAAGLKCKELGLKYRIFDKGEFATTIQNYPRAKVVMAEPAHIPLFGSLWLKDTTKEELIGKWREVIQTTGLQICSNEAVTGVSGAAGAFQVETAKGVYRARQVILAVGTRGSPRKLGAEGECDERVKYLLTDPDEFANRHLLVVGGGDSAVEAAMSLADVPGTTVSLSYRRDSFGRIKAGNRTRLDKYQAEQKLTVILGSTVKAVEAHAVLLKTKDGERQVPNETVFAMLGAEPPTKFFEKIGIKVVQPGTKEMEDLAKTRGNRRFANKCDHCADYSDPACIAACPTGAILDLPPSSIFVDISAADEAPRFDDKPFVEGLDDYIGSKLLRRWARSAAMLSFLIAVGLGMECMLRLWLPELSALAYYQGLVGISAPITFEPGSGLGYYLGIVGTSLMGVTSLYPVVSRLGWLRRFAKTKFWLAAHIVAGLLGPGFVTYHTTLKLDRWPSIAFWCMWLVVLSGLVGRYVFTYLRKSVGLVQMEAQALEDAHQDLIDSAEPALGRTQVFKLDQSFAARREERFSGLFAPFSLIWHQVESFFALQYLRLVELRPVEDRELKRHTVHLFRERKRNEGHRMFLEGIEESATVWRNLHLGVTILMFAVAAAHIVVASLYKAS